MLAARALGLDCGPLSGFNNAKVDEEFFLDEDADTAQTEDLFRVSKVKSNFLCNLGYGDVSKLYARGPRPEFDEICKLL